VSHAALQALTLSCWVAALAVFGVMLVAVPTAYALARWEFRGKAAFSALLTLPLVLPPTAVGVLLLELLADRGPLGREVLGFDPDLLFTWRAAVIAAAVMAFPLVVRTARVAFEGVEPRLEAVAFTLGSGRLRTFFRVTLPLAARGLVAAALLGYMRAFGEFGATVMIAGNFPGRTQTLALAIYGAQQSGQEHEAWVLVGVALTAGFLALFGCEALVQRRPPARRRSAERA
jgi:molybdate transport system permease protein